MDFVKVAADLKKITYVNTYDNPYQNKIIRVAEKVLVRSKLRRRFFELIELLESGMEVDQAVLKAFGLKVNILRGAVENIPKSGTTLIVGNHPFGIVDGMVAAAIIRGYRKDVKILAHQGISNLPQFTEYFLPINFDRSSQAKETNQASTKEFKEHLSQGGLGIIFPAGAVSYRKPLWKKNADPPWHPSVGKWATTYNAAVVPVFIDGNCSWFFQLVSQFSMTLRLSALLYENSKKIDSTIGFRIGEKLEVTDLPEEWDIPKITKHFRQKSYELAGLDSQGRKL